MPSLKSRLWKCWGDSYDTKVLYHSSNWRFVVNLYPPGANALGLRPNSRWGAWSLDLGRIVIRWVHRDVAESWVRRLDANMAAGGPVA